MKKALLLVGLLVVAGTIATLGVASGKSSAFRPKPATLFCENVIIDKPNPNQLTLGTGEVLTADTDGTSCFPYNIQSYQWQRDGVAISGATASTYTTQTADESHTITVKVTDTNGDSQVSPTGVAVTYGACKLCDNFNGSSGTVPSTSTWSYPTSSSGGITYVDPTQSGNSTYLSEDGSGNLLIQAENSGGVWKSAELNSVSTYSGARFIEVREEAVCYSGVGAHYATFDTSAGTPNDQMEIDLNEQQSGSAANWATHNFNVHHFDAVSEWHTEHWDHVDSDNDGDYSSDNDSSDETSVCGSFHTYGALVTSTQITFYYDGTLQFTVNKSDCAFKDPDGQGGSTNDNGGDSDCSSDNDADSDGIQNFTNYSQTFVADIFSHDDSATCPTDENDGGVTDYDDPGQPGACVSDSDMPGDTDSGSDDGIGGSGPVQWYIDYVHVYSQS